MTAGSRVEGGGPPAAVTARAAAKINLHLGVGAPRDDGFHPLATVYQAVSLYDDVTARVAAGRGLRVEGVGEVDVSGVPVDEGNLAARAASALARRAGRDPGHGREVELTIEKSIPVAGGLAGGSADAAATLVALDRLLDLRTPDDDLLELAAELGSDVPFALLGGCAVGQGRGELLTPVADDATWWWVVVPHRVGLSTPEVYAHFDRMRPDAPTAPPSVEPMLAALATGDPLTLAGTLHNDLQEPAIDLRPELGDLLALGESAGALAGLLSGSGPTTLFLCGEAEHAREVAAEFADGPDTPGVQVAYGPTNGVHVLDRHWGPTRA